MSIDLIIEAKIEKGIPIPDIHGKEKNSQQEELLSKLKSMKLGDSFFVFSGSPSVRNNIAATVHGRATKIGMKFATRTIREAGKVGIRVWRIV